MDTLRFSWTVTDMDLLALGHCSTSTALKGRRPVPEAMDIVVCNHQGGSKNYDYRNFRRFKFMLYCSNQKVQLKNLPRVCVSDTILRTTWICFTV